MKENHKKLPVIAGTEKEVLGDLVWVCFFFSLSLCFQKTITLLEDKVYPGKEVGQVELSREIVSCTVSVFYKGCFCEHPFHPVRKYLKRRNRKILPNCASCWKQALQARPFSPGRTLANVWVKDKKQ